MRGEESTRWSPDRSMSEFPAESRKGFVVPRWERADVERPPLLNPVEGALDRGLPRDDASGGETPREASRRFDAIIGSSHAMHAVFDVIERVAPAKVPVLITGESGTGKDLVARAIHENSPRARAPFIKLHCAALAETILESELFGHERGAFASAVNCREGRFRQADGGTLFLDEIGEVSLAVQVKLLRFLQERAFERVGSNERLKVDVRVLAATNRNLSSEVASGTFREDLYYRLNVVNVEMPPLRARPTDLSALAWHFLRKFAEENVKPIEGFAEDAIDHITAYRWPGNVRELEHAIEHAVVLCEREGSLRQGICRRWSAPGCAPTCEYPGRP